jgi:hypothetical protein
VRWFFGLKCRLVCANLETGFWEERRKFVSMSELYESFIDGRITRGAFIRRLVAFGVAVPVASAYAAALRPGSASAADGSDLYDLYHGPHTGDDHP